MAVNDGARSRAPLDKALVVRAAVELADEEGLDALSMRSLAGRLGVTAMSLYNHVANKDEILREMLDVVFAEVELPDAPDWRAALRANSISARGALLRHRWATSLMMSAGGAGPARMRLSDWQLRTLRRAALSEDAVFHAFHVLESYLLGSTLQQLSFPYRGEELAGIARRFLRDFPMDDYPDMAEHIQGHLARDEREGSGFEFGLDLILDGLERTGGTDGPGGGVRR